jgi:hypothetical protein
MSTRGGPLVLVSAVDLTSHGGLRGVLSIWVMVINIGAAAEAPFHSIVSLL